jgi:hypothetical protein
MFISNGRMTQRREHSDQTSLAYQSCPSAQTVQEATLPTGAVVLSQGGPTTRPLISDPSAPRPTVSKGETRAHSSTLGRCLALVA